MPSGLPDVSFKSIGFVRSPVKQAPGPAFNWKSIISEIIIDKSLIEALDNLDEFSHIIVLYWMHGSGSDFSLKVHPRANPHLPLVGLFATRSPFRPNSIGKSTVRLLGRKENILTIEGLDAIDGTPVIDIKPYIPDYDSVTEARVPGWIKKK